jgi:tRNA threonylcarbamoyladenosine biosynthesis protein TsaB
MPRESQYPAKILGWDTSARRGYLFAAEIASEAEAPIIRNAQILDVDQKQHSEGLLLGISGALESCDWSISDISAWGVGVGPGSFTGIRVGLTTARTLGQVQGAPLVRVSSLEMLETAWRRASGQSSLPVLICADACMGEIYCRMSSPELGTSAELVTKIRSLPEHLQRWFGSCSGEPVCHAILPDSWKSHPVLVELFASEQWRVVESSSLKDIPGSLAELVAREWKAGGAVTALEVHPVYLRVSDAELHLRARENALRNPSGGG